MKKGTRRAAAKSAAGSVAKSAAKKNGRKPELERVSKLGRELQKLVDEYAAAGGKFLNRRELYREIAERRGLR